MALGDHIDMKQSQAESPSGFCVLFFCPDMYALLLIQESNYTCHHPIWIDPLEEKLCCLLSWNQKKRLNHVSDSHVLRVQVDREPPFKSFHSPPLLIWPLRSFFPMSTSYSKLYILCIYTYVLLLLPYYHNINPD